MAINIIKCPECGCPRFSLIEMKDGKIQAICTACVSPMWFKKDETTNQGNQG